jgi:GNAT superfamily N-acetyltransferase
LNEADRLHCGLCTVFERLCGALEGSRFERRPGYVWLAVPAIPIPQFSGVWPIDDSAADALADALGEIAALALPYSVQTRRGRTPSCERRARELGLISEVEIPSMAANRQDLRAPAESRAEIIRVATADGLAQALAVAATGFGAPPDLFAPLYLEEVAQLDGVAYYLARVGETDVATALSFEVDGAVGIFNVATPAEHRGRGYGAAVTHAAVQEAFDRGADLAWLQSSDIGHSVYKRLGFRDVETYVMYTAPEAVVV